MSFARSLSAQVLGLKTHIITIEVDISNGLHAFSIVGLPDKSVEESRDRISAAIKNSGFESPKQKNEKVTVSLAPADLKKEGALFDFPSALAYLLAAKEVRFDPAKRLFVGELSLDGKLRPIKGALLIAAKARREGFQELYLPEENAAEAAVIPGISVFGCKTLGEAVEHLNERVRKEENSPAQKKLSPRQRTKIEILSRASEWNFEDIRGQETGKRGLLIAAAGKHNALMWGPPGTGKTMLARAFNGILPPLDIKEVLETTGIHSAGGSMGGMFVTHPPLRTPHHTSSYVSVIGGGTIPRPGEATFAHRGVLFMDEFPEFERKVIEALREPLEEGRVRIARAKGTENFPARFILLAAMNPCPCGYRGSKRKKCVCSPIEMLRYEKKISGPIADRIDIWLEAGEIDYEKLSGKEATGETSVALADRVSRARQIQKKRFKDHARHITVNSEMSSKDMEKLAPLSEKEKKTLNSAAEKLGLSPRAYHRTIKVARTIADLDEAPDILENHLMEALQYRPKNIFGV